MSTQTLELDSLSTQIDQTVTPNFNNLTLDDSTEPTTDGWGWSKDEFNAKSEVNQDYNETANKNWSWGEETQKVEVNAKSEVNQDYNETANGNCSWAEEMQKVEVNVKSEVNQDYNETTNENWSWGEEMQKVEEDNAFSFPVRNGVPDCTFYLKTGSCKFGWNCRFNHPVDVTRNKAKHRRERESFQPGELNVNGASPVMFGQANAENTYNENKWGDYSESNGQVNCKYYSTIGGCKYGSACKYFHKDKNDDPAALNFVGLPMRPGEKECAYYMNTGSCKYSTNCRYHHPEPTAVGARSPTGAQNGRNSQHYSSPVPQDGGSHQPYAWQTGQQGRPQQPYASPVHQNGGSQQPYASSVHQNGGSPAQMPMDPWPLHRNPNDAVPYANNTSPYATTGHYVPQQSAQFKAEWNGYQVNGFAPPSMGPDGEYPERPGQQECQFFMRTGDCKFKAACRYHHPKHRQQSSEVLLNPLGLPLRPDQPICVHFSRNGSCKFGSNCRYHHPANLTHSPVISKAENDSFPYSENGINNVQAQQSGW